MPGLRRRGHAVRPCRRRSGAARSGARRRRAVGLDRRRLPLFLQISDTHIGFNKEANPDVAGTLKQTIDLVNAMPVKPALTIHTGDITHLSKPEEFDTAAQLLSGLNITELHTVPGEHDVTDGPGTEYFTRFGQASGNKGYYSFDHQRRALRRAGQCDELQAQRPGRASATTSSPG